jgi:orotate phosphoribosyltransferase
MGRARLAAAITAASTLTGEFTLRSGQTSREYFDKYRFEADPTLLGAIAEQLAALIPPATDALAGLELGGVPLATALSLRTLVIKDVVTSGGRIVESTLALRGLGAVVTDAAAVKLAEGSPLAADRSPSALPVRAAPSTHAMTSPRSESSQLRAHRSQLPGHAPY